jgi:uncharacterized protein (TIGR00369 family)
MKELPHTRSCFVCGESNPLGLNLRFHSDGERVHTTFVPKQEYNGFKNVTHGGLVATVLDEVMVWAVGVNTKRFSFCAEMNVRYLSPATPSASLQAVGELVENRRDRMFITSGKLIDEAGKILARATGKYLPIPPEMQDEVADDFVGGPPAL